MNNAGNFQVELVHFPETNIAVYEHRAVANLLEFSLAQFISWRKENALPPSKSKTFNIIYDDPNVTADANYRFDIACEVKGRVADNPYGVMRKKIPAGQCAKVRLVGNDDKLAAVISFLYEQWLRQSTLTLRDYPLFLQRLSFYPEVTGVEAVTDIYLPIQ